jgi:hypothetical protein
VEADQKFIFVHIPKTAGLSIRKLFEATFGAQNVSQPFVVSKVDQRQQIELKPFAMISGHISALDLAQFPDRRWLTFLRDPVDRCLSIYSYYRNHTDRPLIPLDEITCQNRADEAISLARQLDPDDFFRSDHPHIVQNIHNRMVWQLGLHAEYSYRGSASDQEALDRALQNLDQYCFVGFYEHLADDVNRLQAIWGVDDRPALPSINRTSNRLQQSDLSAAALTRLRQVTAFDQRLYDAALSRRAESR